MLIFFSNSFLDAYTLLNPIGNQDLFYHMHLNKTASFQQQPYISPVNLTAQIYSFKIIYVDFPKMFFKKQVFFLQLFMFQNLPHSVISLKLLRAENLYPPVILTDKCEVLIKCRNLMQNNLF